MLSLIVPAYNEQDYLPALLNSVEIARSHHNTENTSMEVIIADNCSTDRTAEVALSYGCRVVRVEKTVIAAVRNAGAAAAKGDILMFVDADSVIHRDTFNAVERAMSEPGIIGGATGIRMERMSPGIALSYWAMVPMLWITGIDTGVVFCRKKDFIATDGYNEEVLFAEDVQFLMNLKQLGRSRDQKLVKLHSTRAITSARKFDERGDWHYFTILARGFLGFFLPAAHFNKFARKYWYENQRDNQNSSETSTGMAKAL
ncbi:MAG: glycosyltransferase [Candidatus Fermentibacteria bacterium]|nr:glycosyltransferase [Candidatus Fermentibacteria bacterium]